MEKNTVKPGAFPPHSLDERSRTLALLSLAIGAGLEGETRRLARRAQDLGLGEDELRELVNMARDTLGLSSFMAARVVLTLLP